MPTVPTVEPIVIRAGDSVAWSRSLPDYPASGGWTLAYRLVGAASVYAIITVGSGDTHNVSLTAATTATYTAGDYQLVGTATKGAERATIYVGRVSVLPDLGAVASLDPRSAAEVELAAAKAARVSGVLSYQIADRSVTYRSEADLLARIRYLEQQITRERTAQALAAGTGMPPGRVMVRSAG